MTAGPVEDPLLVHDRIDANRRRIRLLRVAFPLLLLPTFFHATAYLTFFFSVSTGALQAPGAGRPPTAQLLLAGLASVALVVAVTTLLQRHAAALLLRLTGARPLEGGSPEEARLARIVENLCIGSGLPRPRLGLIESDAANAYSTGMDPEGAALVVTRGLLRLLDRRELEGVLARELSQIGNEDVRLGTWMAAVVTVLWLPFLLVRRLYRSLYRYSPRLGVGFLVVLAAWIGVPSLASIAMGLELGLELLGEGGAGEMPVPDPRAGLALVSVMLLALYHLVAAPVLGLLIRRGVSRQREFLADADAALLTGYPPGLALALVKLGTADNAALEGDPSLTHLWIVDPRPGKGAAALRIGSSHLPLGERIERLSRLGGTTPSMLEQAALDAARYAESAARGPRVRRQRRAPSAAAQSSPATSATTLSVDRDPRGV